MCTSKPHKTTTELHTYFCMVRSGMLCRYNVYSEDTDLGELRGKLGTWGLGDDFGSHGAYKSRKFSEPHRNVSSQAAHPRMWVWANPQGFRRLARLQVPCPWFTDKTEPGDRRLDSHNHIHGVRAHKISTTYMVCVLTKSHIENRKSCPAEGISHPF